ncbi:inter-alpha-trypsin inhibitor heavy chain H3-like isoform X2 [Physella acuta]|uniref:inter-alpha-trypsin inhibitor heavy chain H3-like isoform X2 n=1 Tax=Physella acuta TaxID=109671 RepID=UPI0027DD652A|nr:inter-alpha-trypsin inhibitor heavy chain H3-like isoform X2 [Physella acuta]
MRRSNFSRSLLGVSQFLAILVANCLLGSGQVNGNDVTKLPKSTKVIESFHIRSDIRYRFATTQLESLVRNTANNSQQIDFSVTLPKEAFIVDFFMEIDGKKYDGVVKEKSQAKTDYIGAVNRGESAGLVRQAPRHSNLFDVSVNIAAGSAVNFTLTYQERLMRKLGVYEHEIYMNPRQPVQDFSVEVYIQENRKLTFVKTPALRKDSLVNEATNDINDQNVLAVVDQPTPESAYIVYKPSIVAQGNEGLAAHFVVQYDVEHSSKGEVLVVDGYFLHFFAPELPALPKDIVFILDVSGSMMGTKLSQLKTAMKKILEDLQPEDRFNIIKFSTDLTKWRDNLVPATPEAVEKAKLFVDKMDADGLTNINKALLGGIKELQSSTDKKQVGMIFFLTDGEATKDETNPEKIAQNVLRMNEGKKPIFCLAFGSSADFSSLKVISTQNSGFAKKIYEASDAALQVSTLYQEISTVILENLTISYLPSEVDVNTITENYFPVIFNGTEICVVGRMTDKRNELKVEIQGRQKSGVVNLVLDFDSASNFILSTDSSRNPFFSMPRDYSGSVEKMWAYMTIKNLLKEKEKVISQELKANELDQKILQLSLQYKFVTPLTSMVVTKPDEEKPVQSEVMDSDQTPPYHQALSHLPPVMQAASASFYPQNDNSHMSHYPRMSSFPRGTHFYRKSLFPYVPTTNITRIDHVANHHADRQHDLNSQSSRKVSNKKLKKKISGHSKKNKHKGAFALPLFFVEENKSVTCFEMEKIKTGKYDLLVLDPTLKISIDAICKKRSCEKMIITAQLDGNSADVMLDGNPMTSNNSGLNITEDKDSISVDLGTVRLTVNSSMLKGGNIYDVMIYLDSNQKYTGLLSQPKQSNRKQKKPKWKKSKGMCTLRQGNNSVIINMKKAKGG